MAKNSAGTDRFVAIDSNLLFEFSPMGNRESCVKDTLIFVNECQSSEDWIEGYKELVTHYASHYGEDLVNRNWENYQKPGYLRSLDNRINEFIEDLEDME